MSHKDHIDIDYLARVEGETAVRIELDKQPAIHLKIFEPPRFFEGFLVGRKYDEVGDIVSRICGICPVSHMTTAIQAVENALGITVSGQTVILRKIICISQVVASHLIHLYMLSMPDYYGYKGIIEMLPDFKNEISRLLKMKEIMNKLTAIIGGRALHPVTHLPGGFTVIPRKQHFKNILKKLKEIKSDAIEVVKDVSRFKVPDFKSESEFVALDNKDEYAVNEGRIVSSLGLNIKTQDYRDYFQESEINYAFAKQSRIKGRASFMVGALARINLKSGKLQETAKSLLKEIGFMIPNNNPFYNNLAQAIEILDGIDRCIKLIESCMCKDEEINISIKQGSGASITEAPRGLLYHWYKINRQGVVEEADIVTPTSHNFLNIEKDLKKLAAENTGRKREEIVLLCEQLVRAYDPCFSCSVH